MTVNLGVRQTLTCLLTELFFIFTSNNRPELCVCVCVLLFEISVLLWIWINWFSVSSVYFSQINKIDGLFGVQTTV